MTLYWKSRSDFVLNFHSDVCSMLEVWIIGTSLKKLEVSIQRSEFSLVVYFIRSFLIETYYSYITLHLNRVRWWISISSIFNVSHTFKKSLFFCFSTSYSYGFNLLSHLMCFYIQLKHTNCITHGLYCWSKFLTGLPCRSTSVKVLTIVAYDTHSAAQEVKFNC